MSADNYFLITTHPKGGFAVVQGFASDDETPVAEESDRQFLHFDEAESEAFSEYSEYGVRVSADAQKQAIISVYRSELAEKVRGLQTRRVDLVSKPSAFMVELSQVLALIEGSGE